MADQELESGQEQAESVAAPLPKISDVSGVEPASVSTVDAEALDERVAQRVLAKLDEVIDRRLQSTKDKRFATLEGLDPDALKRFNSYVKKFGDEDEAIRQMRVDTLITQSSPKADQGRSPTLETKSTEAILAEVKADFGIELAPNDPELVEAAKKTYSSWDAWEKTVSKIGARRLKQGTVSATAVVAETQQKPPTGGSIEAAQEKLVRLQANLKTRPAEIEKAMTELQEAMSRQR